MPREIALFASHCVINVGKCDTRCGGEISLARSFRGSGMELRVRTAAIAAAFAIPAALAACAAPDGAATAAAVSAIPARALSSNAARAPEIEDLRGLEPADVVSLLGPPDLRRDEPPAKLWQYRAAGCVLNLFFYSETGRYRLAHVEAWQRTLSSGSAPARCHDEDAPIKAHLVSRSSL
jgi:hypothetical protein